MNQLTDDPLSVAAEMLAREPDADRDAGAARRGVRDGRVDGRTEGRNDGMRSRPANRPSFRHSVLPSSGHGAHPGAEASTPPIPPAAATSSARAVSPGCSAETRWKQAVASANRAAARNVTFRGAGGLAAHLRGELVAPDAHRDDSPRRSTTGPSTSSPPASGTGPPRRGCSSTRAGRVGVALRPHGAADRRAGDRRGSRLETPRLTMPDNDEVRSYWSRAGFFNAAAECFELVGKVPKPHRGRTPTCCCRSRRSGPSTMSIAVVEADSGAGPEILPRSSTWRAEATVSFAMALSEACQNIVEHAGTGGWVAVQTLQLEKTAGPPGRGHRGERLRDRVPPLARVRRGQEGRRSLGRRRRPRARAPPEHQPLPRPGPGPGPGEHSSLPWTVAGKISVRSGTARLAVVPAWDDDEPLAEYLPFFPGSQVRSPFPPRRALQCRSAKRKVQSTKRRTSSDRTAETRCAPLCALHFALCALLQGSQ